MVHESHGIKKKATLGGGLVRDQFKPADPCRSNNPMWKTEVQLNMLTH
jgi:hypothetical protein